MRAAFALVALALVPAVSVAQSSATESEGIPPITRVTKGGQQQGKLLLKKVVPVYPEEAKHKHISGTVRLHVIVGNDGNVKELNPISGPPELIQAASDAVSQWQYKQTRLQGRPVEVDTVVEVVFSLN